MQAIVFTGGGTGGHVYPGLAVIQALRAILGPQCPRIIWMGSRRGLERTIVEQFGLDYAPISTGKLRRYWDIKNLIDGFRVMAGYLQSLLLLRQWKPMFVFSKGGFVSVPPVRAAQHLGIPVYSHESDLDPGLATRLNLAASRLIFCAYAESLQHFPAPVQSRLRVVGNPVRSDLAQGQRAWVDEQWPDSCGKTIVLVLGGSQGAQEVNDLVLSALPLWTERYFVIHQTGPQATPPRDSPFYASRPSFGPELAHLYAAASVVVGRAGAGTLWEAASLGVPLVLIPLRAGTRGDQVRNAALFESRGAAVVLPAHADATLLNETLTLVLEPERAKSMARALRDFKAAESAELIAHALVDEHAEAFRV